MRLEGAARQAVLGPVVIVFVSSAGLGFGGLVQNLELFGTGS